MATSEPRQYLPLTCHGHSRPVPHLSFSRLENDGEYFIISACKGSSVPHSWDGAAPLPFLQAQS